MVVVKKSKLWWAQLPTIPRVILQKLLRDGYQPRLRCVFIDFSLADQPEDCIKMLVLVSAHVQQTNTWGNYMLNAWYIFVNHAQPLAFLGPVQASNC